MILLVFSMLIVFSGFVFTVNEVYKKNDKIGDSQNQEILLGFPVLGSSVSNLKIPENPYSNGGGGGSSSKKSSKKNSEEEKHPLEDYEENYEEFKLVEVDDKIVYFYQRMIGDAIVEKDFKSYQFDQEGNFLKKEIHLRDDLDDYVFPENIISSEEAEVLVEGEIEFSKLYIISPDSEIFLIKPTPKNPCWIVSTSKNGSITITIIDSVDGEILGEGVPPRYSGFSLSGPMVHNPCGFSWENQYLNAESWFNEMGYNTEAVEWPTKAKIQSHIQSNELKMFYEIAHGTSLSFGGGCVGGFYETTYASEIETWMTESNKIPFNFLSSCNSMCELGDNTLSYELMKGSNEDTTAMGYCGLDTPECWDCFVYSPSWENVLFNYMNQGYNVKDAFDQAQADYPFCVSANCVRFTGDENFKVLECDENWGNNYCKENDVYHNKTCINLIDVVMMREEEKVSECGEEEYSENYCYEGDIYKDFTDRGCSSGSCFETTERQLVENCEYSCNNAECVYPDLIIEDLVIQKNENQIVVLAFTIKNIGNFIAENIFWMVDTDSGDDNPERIEAINLDVGDFERVYMRWTYASSGTYNPNVIVDFDNLILESNEDNNEGSILVDVQ